jgi:hypothetical protein
VEFEAQPETKSAQSENKGRAKEGAVSKAVRLRRTGGVCEANSDAVNRHPWRFTARGAKVNDTA